MPVRFQCPACQSVLECPERKAGEKIVCPKCGQRLQIPRPAPPQRNRTVLGRVMDAVTRPAQAKPRPASSAPAQAPRPAPAGRKATAPAPRRPASAPEHRLPGVVKGDRPAPPHRQRAWPLSRRVTVVVAIGVVLLVAGTGTGIWFLKRKPTQQVIIRQPDGSAFVLEVPDAPSPAEQEKELLGKITTHRFWKQKPTAEQMKKLADKMTELHQDCAVFFDDQFHVVVLDPKKDEAAKEYFSMRRQWEKERLDYGPPEGIGKRYFEVSMGQWSTRPSRLDVLESILSGADRADFR
jgi:hypothetical protein